MREYFYVCCGCNLWEVHLPGNVPLLYVGIEAHVALLELIDEHLIHCPEYAIRPLSVPSQNFRAVQ